MVPSFGEPQHHTDQGLNCPTVEITQVDYTRVMDFVLKMYYVWGGARGDFRSSGVERDIGKYINDHIGGKLAEIGVQKILEGNGKSVKISFEQYQSLAEMGLPDIEGVYNPDGTLRNANVTVEIKDTKTRNKWWTIPWHEWTGRPRQAYIFVNVDLPLDHLIRYFKPHLSAPAELMSQIPDFGGIRITISSIYYRNDLEQRGGYMEAGTDSFFDADSLFTSSPRLPAGISEPLRVSSFGLSISHHQFSTVPEVILRRKQNRMSVTTYLSCEQRTIISHPVVGSYDLSPGLYRVVDKASSDMRENNFGLHKRNLSFDSSQWNRLLNEL